MCHLVLKAAHRTLQQARSTLCVLQIRHINFHSVHLQNNVCSAIVGASLRQSSKHSRFVGLRNVPTLLSRSISVDFRLRNRGDKERSHVSVTRSPNNTSGLSPAQKGGLLYILFKELLSSSSPNKIYGKALDKCRAHPEVIGAFGEPIKGYGETSRRGRRQQIGHAEFFQNGKKHMRLKFYIEGSEPQLQGTVHTEVMENPETGKYEFRYVFVDMDTYPRRTIVVEDNR